MSTVAKLTKEKIQELLSGGKSEVEIETEESTEGFNFHSFFTDVRDEVKLNYNNGITILKSRKQVYAACKSGNYKFCGKKIVASGDNVGPNDWTFKRTEAVIRTLMISIAEKTENEEEKQKMYEKAMQLPLVAAYGLTVPAKFDMTALRLMLCIGGPLSLLASLHSLCPVVLPLAYFQNVKKEQLGIKNFSTYEQICKIARVMSASNMTFKKEFDELFKSCVKILADCKPGTTSGISLKIYNEQVQFMEQAFKSSLVVDGMGESSSKSKVSSSRSKSIEV
uniref:Nucleoprotein n=1 Tax=Melon yellow spot virus TaxID=89471 RepID=A0A385FQ62_9VIRU|nr:nucleocapsid protein [Melon yellow spot virus]